jgi:hypothetical protein
MEYRGVAHATADKDAAKEVLAAMAELHESGVDEVAFASQYLYRKASIRPEYLKGSDAFLYNELVASGAFDVSLHPVVLRESSNRDGEIDEHSAYLFDDEPDNESGASESKEDTPPKKNRRDLVHSTSPTYLLFNKLAPRNASSAREMKRCRLNIATLAAAYSFIPKPSSQAL